VQWLSPTKQGFVVAWTNNQVITLREKIGNTWDSPKVITKPSDQTGDVAGGVSSQDTGLIWRNRENVFYSTLSSGWKPSIVAPGLTVTSNLVYDGSNTPHLMWATVDEKPVPVYAMMDSTGGWSIFHNVFQQDTKFDYDASMVFNSFANELYVTWSTALPEGRRVFFAKKTL